jgi:hypothetical protein
MAPPGGEEAIEGLRLNDARELVSARNRLPRRALFCLAAHLPCFECHGPDAHARKAELRLDVRENALAEHDSGRPVVPGQADRSELVKRIESTDADEQMPQPTSHLRLSRAESAYRRGPFC